MIKPKSGLKHAVILTLAGFAILYLAVAFIRYEWWGLADLHDRGLLLILFCAAYWIGFDTLGLGFWNKKETP